MISNIEILSNNFIISGTCPFYVYTNFLLIHFDINWWTHCRYQARCIPCNNFYNCLLHNTNQQIVVRDGQNYYSIDTNRRLEQESRMDDHDGVDFNIQEDAHLLKLTQIRNDSNNWIYKYGTNNNTNITKNVTLLKVFVNPSSLQHYRNLKTNIVLGGCIV